MRQIVVALICIFSCVAAASDADIKLVQPKESTLKLKKLKTKDDLSASFSGEIWVTGTLIGERGGFAGKGIYLPPTYVLVPDTKSKKKLPYFTIKEPSIVLRYPIKSINIENGHKAIEMAVGAKKADLLLKGKVVGLKVTGDFLLVNFAVGVECDAPWARASIHEVVIPDPAKVAKVESPEGC